jgi:hypothetical protein
MAILGKNVGFLLRSRSFKLRMKKRKSPQKSKQTVLNKLMFNLLKAKALFGIQLPRMLVG